MIDVSNIEARHLSVWNVLGLAAAAVLALYAVAVVVAQVAPVGWNPEPANALLAGMFAALLSWMTYEFVRPEHEGFCDVCGDPLLSHNRSDETTTHLRLAVSHAPRRLEIRGLSLVISPRHYDRYYCSPECAQDDDLDHHETRPTKDLDEVDIPGESVDPEVSD